MKTSIEKDNDKNNFILKVLDIEENDDGSSTMYFDLSNEFVEWFKEDQGLKRWSQKRFQKFVNEGLKNYVDKLKYKHKKEDCVAYEQGGMGCPDCIDLEDLK